MNFELSIGDTREAIEVVASAVQLKTEDAAIGQVIDNKRVIELPLNGRNISALAVLTAGVQFGFQRSGEAAKADRFPAAWWRSTPTASVRSAASHDRRRDRDGISEQHGRFHSVDRRGRRIQSTDQFLLGRVRAEHRSGCADCDQVGTNQFHGTFYEFLRNDKLAAKDYFLNFELPAGARRFRPTGCAGISSEFS